MNSSSGKWLSLHEGKGTLFSQLKSSVWRKSNSHAMIFSPSWFGWLGNKYLHLWQMFLLSIHRLVKSAIPKLSVFVIIFVDISKIIINYKFCIFPTKIFSCIITHEQTLDVHWKTNNSGPKARRNVISIGKSGCCFEGDEYDFMLVGNLSFILAVYCSRISLSVFA